MWNKFKRVFIKNIIQDNNADPNAGGGWSNWSNWPSVRVRNRDFFGLPPLWHFHRILAGRGDTGNNTHDGGCK
jgi:hypothetical protein